MLVDFGDLPTWIASIGTVGALFLALRQIQTERQRRLDQEQKERDERHRYEAQLISAAIIPALQAPDSDHPPSVDICVINNSNTPVYRLVVGIVYIESGTGPATLEQTLHRGQKTGQSAPVSKAGIAPSGNSRIRIGETGSDISTGQTGAEVAFTNSEGHWIRRATGELEELHREPFEYFKEYGLGEAYRLRAPEQGC